MESRVCTVVDVSRWKRLLNAMRELFVGQTERADVVLMNKADLVSEDVLRTVEKDIAEMNRMRADRYLSSRPCGGTCVGYGDGSDG